MWRRTPGDCLSDGLLKRRKVFDLNLEVFLILLYLLNLNCSEEHDAMMSKKNMNQINFFTTYDVMFLPIEK